MISILTEQITRYLPIHTTPKKKEATMSLNQPNPPKQPSLLHRAKQTVSAATTKVTTSTKQAIEQKAHQVLPTKLANLTLGPGRRADERHPPAPAYPRYRSPSPDGMGIVEAEIESASEGSGGVGGGGYGGDDDDDGDRSASSWEEAVVPPGAVVEDGRVQPRERGEREWARVRFAGDDDGMESDGIMVESSGSELGPASPPPLRDGARDITERERRLMRAQHRAERRRGGAAAGRGRARGVVQARGDRSSSEEEEEEGHMSNDSDDFPRGSEQVDTAHSRSWGHGIGRTTVTVPCDSRGELERTYQGARRVEEAHEPHPRELLEELGAREYMPVGVVRDPGSVGGDLSRFRNMGKYFKSGSVGNGEGARS